MVGAGIKPFWIAGIRKMDNINKVLSGSEKAVYSLRSLYTSYGYVQYKMSKFEEYDLYVRNKDFLVSDAVITFTDTDGKLLALKPDVTLSIIKNGKDIDNGVKKVCYGENVYRPSKGTRSFKELMQVGLECQGDIDDYIITEVLALAVKSLKSISEDYALDISSLDVVSGVLEDLSLNKSAKKEILEYLGEKNADRIADVLDRENIDQEKGKALIELSKLYGAPTKVVEILNGLNLTGKAKEGLDKLQIVTEGLSALGLIDNVNIDFSVVDNMNYYNGIVFKGFISGIPTGILSGGQYDNLMQKMGRKNGAIGFAVYMDELESISNVQNKYDVDVVVLYDNKTPIGKVNELVENTVKGGETVLATKTSPDKLRYKRLIKA